MKKIFTFIFTVLILYSASAQNDSSYYTIRLSSFNASVNNNVTKLYFKTVCFLQYANFQIQKSADGIEYKTIHTFTADRVRCQQPFDFADSSKTNLGNVFYRINVGNIDGKYYNSLVRKVFLKEKGFGIISTYPTIATDRVQIILSNNEDDIVNATIINQNGTILQSKKLNVINGISNHHFNISNYAPGTYWLVVRNNKGILKNSIFVKQ